MHVINSPMMEEEEEWKHEVIMMKNEGFGGYLNFFRHVTGNRKLIVYYPFECCGCHEGGIDN